MTLNKKVRIIGFVFFAGFFACQDGIKEEKPIASEKKNAITDVVLTDMNNQPINLEQLKGKTVFINFWATWCKPCIQEMPSIKNAQEKLRKTDIVFLLASNEPGDEIIEFEKNYNYNFNYAKVTNLEELGVIGLPTTYIFNQRGELVFSETGYRNWDDTSNIEMILKINSQK